MQQALIWDQWRHLELMEAHWFQIFLAQQTHIKFSFTLKMFETQDLVL